MDHSYSPQPHTHGNASGNDFLEHHHGHAALGDGHKRGVQDRGSIDTLEGDIINPENIDPHDIVFDAPRERFRLGYLDVACLVINRMMGTGIFTTPGKTMVHTQSVGITLLFWLAGIIYCCAGAHVYVEMGLAIPRYIIDGVEQSVPRSGGDLNYLQYMYRKPRYRRETVVYMGVLFGIAFICVGNMAGNCIHFAERVLDAAIPNLKTEYLKAESDPSHIQHSQSHVRLIALAMAAFACFIHAFSRRFGILLNNVLAIVKIAILVLISITAIIVATGGWKYNGETVTRNEFGKNINPSSSFADASNEPNNYAHAFLAIIFACSGFDQPNYVLGELDRPRKKFPISMALGVGTISLTYFAANLSYMVVVPAALQAGGQNVAANFFDMTFGRLGNENLGLRMYNIFLAISSTGNIIVMTYTASRMKQEIAKEGFLPYSRFFAQSRDWSLGRVLHWLQRNRKFPALTNWLSHEDHSEKTPVGALLLHFASCLVLILATWGMTPADAYTLLAGFISYLTTAFFGFFLALGLIILRVTGPPRTYGSPATEVPGDNGGKDQTARPSWAKMMEGIVNPKVSVVCATLYLLGNAFPLITSWVPPPQQRKDTKGEMAWYLTPMISLCVIGFGSLWFLGFIARAKRIERKKGLVFVAERKPEFQLDSESASAEEAADPLKRNLILLHETVYLYWQGRDSRTMDEPRNQIQQHGRTDVDEKGQASSNPLAGTDFDEFH